MMLLQAGQLGLYRKDSIWTDDIPPDMVAGATLWIDGTDSSVLYEDFEFLGSNVTTDGASVFGAMNKVGYPARRGMVETRQTLYSEPSSAPILRLAATPTGKSALGFGKSVDGLTGLREYHADTDVWPTPTNFVTTTQKLIFVAARITSAPATTSTDYMTRLLTDDGRYMGLYAFEQDGVLKVLAYNFSFSNPSGWYATVEREIPRGGWFVATMQHQSGQLKLRVNGGAWTSIAVAATDNMGFGLTTMTYPGSDDVTTEIAHIAAVNTAQTDTAISAVERWIANDVGITPW